MLTPIKKKNPTTLLYFLSCIITVCIILLNTLQRATEGLNRRVIDNLVTLFLMELDS